MVTLSNELPAPLAELTAGTGDVPICRTLQRMCWTAKFLVSRPNTLMCGLFTETLHDFQKLHGIEGFHQIGISASSKPRFNISQLTMRCHQHHRRQSQSRTRFQETTQVQAVHATRKHDVQHQQMRTHSVNHL